VTAGCRITGFDTFPHEAQTAKTRAWLPAGVRNASGELHPQELTEENRDAGTSLPVKHLFTLRVQTGPHNVIEVGPAGTRLVVAVTGGTFEGPKLRGTIAENPGGLS
jgi:hypothetical protein